MFCNKCGAANDPDSLYCKKCGQLMEPEEETRVARRSDSAISADEEVRLFSITPTVKLVYVGYLLAVIAAFFVVAFFSVFLSNLITIWVGVLLGMSLLLVPAFYHVRQKLIRYTLTDSKIEIDRGLIARDTLNVPLRRVQDVTVRRSFSQRLLGMGDVVVDNSGTDGETIILKNVDSPRRYADILLKQMRKMDRVTRWDE
ncbi:MAG: PH domain-containing protein [Blastocatellia bacterium]|nr:PH domain-containing protein [Blastocatellia bacterium]